MYRKDSDSWLKHWDFIILDLVCLQVAFLLAYAISGYGFNPYKFILYRNMAVFLGLVDVVMSVLLGTMKNVLKRGYYVEMIMTIRHGLSVGAMSLCYLFLLQQGQKYSRMAFLFMIPFYIVLAYVVRAFWKRLLRRKKKNGENRSLLIVAKKEYVKQIVKDMVENNFVGYTMAGIAIDDAEIVGNIVEGVKIVTDENNVVDYICKNWVDEVLIATPETEKYPKELIDELTETGVVVHMCLAKITNSPGKKQFVEKVGNYNVLTTTINYASSRQLMLKRCIDITGGIVGCFITAILFIFIAPAIYISSPGPVFFGQERVGKNGKIFKMYKFRSMYMDAEKRKAELMKDNKLSDGKMFKMDFDPRVIGNKILPDGTHKTGIGDFLRRSSIDEFPQFYNVLKGDMSIVGTRPPLISERNLYESHHRVRLAIKPGITGMWQVSGRSDITDFEEVVKLDAEYISNWSIGLDLRIMAKTVAVILKKEGSM